MKMLQYIFTASFITLMMLTGTLSGQSTRKYVRQGNSDYESGNYSDAQVKYLKALENDPNYYKGKFNLGDAMYQQENYEESGKLFNELSERALEPNQKANVYYNQGNNLMKQQKYSEAIESFKNCLRLNPADDDAKYNLQYARKMLKDQQQQQQNQDQNKDQDKKDQQDQQKQDQQKDQDKKDQQDQKDQQQQDKQQDKKQDQNQEQNKPSDQQKQQQQQQPQQISKKDAQKMLEALKNDEKKTLKELQKQKAKAAKGAKTEIDW